MWISNNTPKRFGRQTLTDILKAHNGQSTGCVIAQTFGITIQRVNLLSSCTAIPLSSMVDAVSIFFVVSEPAIKAYVQPMLLATRHNVYIYK